MMTKRRKIRAAIAKAFKAFVKSGHFMRGSKFSFDPNAYYCTLPDGTGPVLLSMRPYYGWSEARRASRRIHPRGFICRGSTMNRLLAS